MALFLDFDNTFLDSIGIYETTIQQFCRNAKEYGFSSAKEFSEFYEAARKETKIELKDFPSNRLRLIYFKKMCLSKWGTLDPKWILKLERDYFRNFQDGIKVRKKKYEKEYKEVFLLLKTISKKHKLLFCTNENLKTQLIKFNLLFPKIFPYVILSSEEVGKEKPSEEFYSRANRLVSEEKVVSMIGDSLKDDIEGALRYGISAIHITSIFSKKQGSLKERTISFEVDSDGKREYSYLETNDLRTALKLFL
ncbi:HAD family hydrolase [Leptospira borgpetersenii]|uniref:HAD family hydrolase n=1 Tax=Leptospira borgpetersenii TaxID=174 RepID=UPI00201FCEFB|nr:HAD family hydrolase [Leptospira borgpetersenii]URD70056.1 HAD family hydrolase [Leptospira borgpetersenii]UVD73230.1 HAD family hydrolase [Leptospira borgpetersenii]UVD76420.1 HAD family hydrolase [Leptospira borgpetersenii]UZW32981.1 HAD family hydrolase [Leptospira borgpetersenii]